MGETSALVSVVIPCRDAGPTIERAVLSALEQPGAEVEVIAVDDGSGDGTRAILDRLAARAPGRITVARSPGTGAGAARNYGLAATNGEYVQFLDADDALRKGKVIRQVELARSHDADVVAGGYANHFENGAPEELVLPLEGDPWLALIRTRLGTTSANLFKRRALMAVGGWDESLNSSQDYELLFRLLRSDAKVIADPVVGCDVLKRLKGSISRTNERENWMRYLDLRRNIRDYLRDHGTDHAEAIAVADQYLFMAMRVLSRHDRTAAFEAYENMLPESFLPEPGAATTLGYIRMFRLFGFKWAERLAAARHALIGR